MGTCVRHGRVRISLRAIPQSDRAPNRSVVGRCGSFGTSRPLRVGDVDLGRKRVRVRRRWYEGTFAPPKSRFGRRDVPLTTPTAQALWPLVVGRDEDAPLFTSVRGRMVDPSNLAARVQKPAARRAGVPWASFHTFRHTAASAFFRAGFNARQVQLVLGHYSPAFTLAVYVHLIADDLPDADLLEGGNAGGNQTGRNEPKGNVGVEAVNPLPERETSDGPKPAETTAAHFLSRGPEVRILPGAPEKDLQGRRFSFEPASTSGSRSPYGSASLAPARRQQRRGRCRTR